MCMSQATVPLKNFWAVLNFISMPHQLWCLGKVYEWTVTWKWSALRTINVTFYSLTTFIHSLASLWFPQYTCYSTEKRLTLFDTLFLLSVRPPHCSILSISFFLSFPFLLPPLLFPPLIPPTPHHLIPATPTLLSSIPMDTELLLDYTVLQILVYNPGSNLSIILGSLVTMSSPMLP